MKKKIYLKAAIALILLVTSMLSSQRSFGQALGTCTPPSYLITGSVTSSSATVSWPGVSGVSSYAVEYKDTGSANWLSGGIAVTSTSLNLWGLAASTAYNVRVRANCTGGGSLYTSAAFVTTANVSCPLTNEPNDVLSSAASINFGATYTGAISDPSDLDFYKLVAPAAGNLVFTLICPGSKDYDLYILNSAGTQLNAATGAASTKTITLNNQAAGTYYIRIKGSNTQFGAGCYSIKATTTATLCANPANLTSNAISASGATISWPAAALASGYAVEYRKAGTTAWMSAASIATTITGSSLTLAGLTPQTTYEWRVRANCANINSAFVTASFTTLALCDAPTNLSTTGILDICANLNWTAVPGAQSYAVDYRLAGSSTWTSLTTATTATSWFLKGLSSLSTYEWRVKTNCSGSGNSGFATTSFSTISVGDCNATYEPNDSYETATPIQPGVVYTSGFYRNDAALYFREYDFYKVVIPQPSLFSVRYTGNRSNEFNTVVRGPIDFHSGELWTQYWLSPADTTVKEWTSYEYAVPAGTYYISAYIDYPPVCYSIEAIVKPIQLCGASTDTITANLESGIPLTGGINYFEDVDVYEFTTQSDGNNVYEFVGGNGASYDVEIGNWFSSWSQAGVSGTMIKSFASQPAGTYTVRIKGHNLSYNDGSCYTIKASTTAVSCNQSFEPNETLSGATGIEPNITYSASIGVPSDVDYYKVSSNTIPHMSCRVYGPGVYDIFVYDSLGTLLNSDTLPYENKGLWLSDEDGLNKTFYIKVIAKNGYYNSDCYDIRVGEVLPERPSNNTPANSLPVASKSLEVYPIPAKELIHISLMEDIVDANARLQIVDINGRLISSQKMSDNAKDINISTLPNGVYLVKVISQNKVLTAKFIKQ